jgi:hypothetical protein
LIETYGFPLSALRISKDLNVCILFLLYDDNAFLIASFAANLPEKY